jgi:hypothetical protein
VSERRDEPALTFGYPDEQRLFGERNRNFFDVLPALQTRMTQVLLRTFQPADVAQGVVFFLGRLAADDFGEILLNSANGYGMAGLKLLRPMFEGVVTALHIANHPDEAEAFLEYHLVHQRKTLRVAEATGVDLSGVVLLEEQARIEARYQEIKDRYRQMLCPECGVALGDSSWTKKDPIAMSRELNLQESAFCLYFYPTLQIHTTPTRLASRLELVASGLRFKEGAQRDAADAALAGAHGCLALILEHHNRYFSLGINGLEEELVEGLQRSWPGQPVGQFEFPIPEEGGTQP